MGSTGGSSPPTSPPQRLKKKEAREALPEELRPIYDSLCEETLRWSQYYYGSNFISYSIIKELVQDGWRKIPHKTYSLP
jgi:hypothetical protein